MAQKRRARPEAPAVPPAAFPFRPPAWVRGWAVSVGLIALALLGVFIYLSARSGQVVAVVVLSVLLVAALLITSRVGGLVAKPLADGRLLVRNRLRTHRYARADVTTVKSAVGAGRGGAPVAVLVLADGTEVAVDATLAAAFQQAQLDAQVSALKLWHRG